MKTFKEFLKEAEETLDANKTKSKQIDNVKYEVKDSTHVNKFRLSINPSVQQWLESLLRSKQYKFEKTGNNFTISVPDTVSGNSIQDMIYTALNTSFVEGNKDIHKFVGSDEIGDFIDTDFNVSIDLLR